MNRPTEPATPFGTPDLLALAETVAREAGALVAEGRRAGVGVSTTKTSPVDVVTALDMASEELIRARLATARPQDGILGEEYGHEAGASGLTWVVDPIDGTVNFLYGLPAYAVSVAVVEGDPTVPGRWTPVAGVVHAPALGRTYLAGRGLGAWCLDERAGTRERLGGDRGVPLSSALVATGFGYRAERRAAQGAVVAALLPRIRDIRRAGAASLDLCAAGAGEVDVYYERGLNPWDLAAGALVVLEAGGVVTGLAGKPAGEAMTLAGPGPLVAELDEILVSLGADSDTRVS